MKEFNIDNIEVKKSNVKNTGKPRIVVIGVGGGGCNAVVNAAKQDQSNDIVYVATNTDLHTLNNIDDPKIKKIQLGKDLCKGLG